MGGAEESVFAEDLSTFDSRFDIHDFSSEVHEIKHSCSVKDDEIEITEDAVLKVFKAISMSGKARARMVCAVDSVLKY